KPRLVGLPATPEDFDFSRGRLEEPLEDLDGGGLPCPVRAQQPEALSSPDVEVEAVHGGHVGIPLDEIAATDGELGLRHRELASLARGRIMGLSSPPCR